MLALLIFIAISNLCWGYVFGCAIRHASPPAGATSGASQSNAATDAVRPPSPRAAAPARPPRPVPTDGIASGAGEAIPARGPNGAIAAARVPTDRSVPTSWSDFGQQLQAIRERIRYARSAGDLRLARKSADQLQACTQAWCSQLQSHLDGGSTAAFAALGGGEANARELEMCLAQFETTLTNIEAIDWAAAIDGVLLALEREAESLEANRRLVSRAST